MAQAIYDDAQRVQNAIQQRLMQTRAAANETINRARGGYPSAAGIDVTEMPSQGATISRADIANRAAQLGQQGGATNTIGSDIPAAARRPITPGIRTGSVDFSSLSPGEQAAFTRQGYTPPQAPAAAAPAPAAAPPAPAVEPAVAEAGIGSRIASAGRGLAGRAALGATRFAAGAVPYVAASTAIGSGIDSFSRPTSDYENRFGMRADSLPKELGVRALGVGTDLAGNVIDALGTTPVNFARSLYGAPPIESVTSRIRANDNPAAAQASRVAASIEGGSNATAAPPSNADFSNVRGNVGSTSITTGLAPDVVPLARPRSDRGNVLPGRVINGVRTFSDGSGDPNAPGYVPRTMSQAEINGLASGNRISVANAGIGGNIASEAAGRTLDLGEGASPRSSGFTAADRAAQLKGIQDQGARYEFNRLMQKSESELARGSRKNASILAGLARQSLEGNAPPAENPEASAKAAEALTAAAANEQRARGEARSNALLDNLANETNPGRRQDLIDTILASRGANSGRVVTLKQQVGQDQFGQPIMQELPFDTRSRQFLYDPRAQPAQ